MFCRPFIPQWCCALLVVIALYAPIAPAYALQNPGEELQKAGVEQKLGSQIDTSIQLVTADAERKSISELLDGGRPVILVPVYYHCPRLCGLVLSGVTDLINSLSLTLGDQYRIVTVSFDSEEGPPLAKKRQEESFARLTAGAPPPRSWEFLVGMEGQVAPLMQQVGFHYSKDGEEFAHSAALIILTPDGKVSQYFTGIEFSPWDVRLALIDASQGAVGSALDHVLLYCFRFDPSKGKYTVAAMNVMKLGGVITLLALGTVIFFSTRRT